MYAWYLLQSCLCEITLPKKQISPNILPGSASIGSGPPVKKRMPSAAWSLLALPREELELARLLGTWCWSPRTADLMPSQSLHLFGVIAIAYIYNIYSIINQYLHYLFKCSTHSFAEGCHSDVPWWIHSCYYHASSQAKATSQSEAGPKG